eukprot:Colp12_sorted_trinity150504_noHs@10652
MASMTNRLQVLGHRHSLRHLTPQVLAVRLLNTKLIGDAPQPAPRVLITGSAGQLGQEMVTVLRKRYGAQNVISSDIRKPAVAEGVPGKFIHADVLNYQEVNQIVVDEGINWIVHFSALLSAIGEKNVKRALDVNIIGFQNVIEIAKEQNLRCYCPSTIGAFGPTTPRDNTPDLTIMRPTTIYGITKVHMELLGEYYYRLRCRDLPLCNLERDVRVLPEARHSPAHDVCPRLRLWHRAFP